MSNRQQRRRLAREEREAREAEAAAKAARRKRLELTFGGFLAVAGIGAVVFAVVGGTKATTVGSPTDPAATGIASVAIPAVQTSGLTDAARAAGCELRADLPDEGQEHIGDGDSFDGYKTDPPTSGTHRLTPATDGIYPPGDEPHVNHWVHTLEHGRIGFIYRPDTPRRTIGQLQTLYAEDFKGSAGYHQFVLRGKPGTPYALAAVGWRNQLLCNRVTDKTWDALRAFREQYVDTAPEQVP